MDFECPDHTTEKDFMAEMNRRWIARESLPTRVVASRKQLLEIMTWASVVTRYTSQPHEYGIESHALMLPYCTLHLAEKPE